MRLPAQPVEQDTISPLELFFGMVEISMHQVEDHPVEEPETFKP
jgi:hypothetical protein